MVNNQPKTAFVRYIKEKGIRRSTIARKTGIPYHRITILVTNPKLEPTLSEALKISEFLEKPVEFLFPESFQKQHKTNSTNNHA